MDSKSSKEQASIPPEAWRPAAKFAKSLVGPVERFMHVEASSGIVLLVAAVVALVWANSPWGESYTHLWETPFTVGVGSWVVEESLHFWINDLLMAIFFLVVGLEIKREIVEGALSDIKRAALPIAAAVGGMVVPAAIFLALNATGPASRGWGVPMATDIAFAVGVLTLLGKRVPAALRVLLLALAIIDDIGAILVIAIFYSSGLQLAGLGVIGIGLLMLLALLGMGIRPGFSYVIPSLIIWGGMIQLGVHPTIAGVLVGLLAPVKPWFGKQGFLNVAHQALEDFRQSMLDPKQGDRELMEPLNRIQEAGREAVAPAQRLQTALHPWVAFGIMPLFALANAGVRLGEIEFGDPAGVAVLLGVGFGLALGKPLGILGFSWLSVKLGLSALPPGVNWRGVFVIGAAGGIGFTMAIFIAELAFPGTGLLGIGKLAVLLGTGTAVAIALLAGVFLLRREQAKKVEHITASELESTPEYWTVGGFH
jgi:NhaA family Na+:H+ antiporter